MTQPKYLVRKEECSGWLSFTFPFTFALERTMSTENTTVETTTVETKTAKAKAAKKAKKSVKKAAPKAKKEKKAGKRQGMSGLDAAAKVLGECKSKEGLNAMEIVERAAAKGYWKSPGGATPHSTIYAAMIREIKVKGKESRFKKVSKGHFVRA
jgi:hypothetical protein